MLDIGPSAVGASPVADRWRLDLPEAEGRWHVCARFGRRRTHGRGLCCRREAHGLMGGSLARCLWRYLYRRAPPPPGPRCSTSVPVPVIVLDRIF